MTGCTATYTITINDDSKISEVVEIEESKEYFDTNYEFYERKEAIDELWKTMASPFSSIGYTYTQNYDHTGINVKNSYNNIEDYINKTTIYTQYFDKINYTIDNGIVKIETEGFNPYLEQDPERFAIESVDINIKIPFQVRSHNADSVYKNIYTWHIDKNTKNKTIKLEYNQNSKQSNSKRVDYLLLFGIIILVSITGLFIYYKVKSTDNSI